MTFPERSRTDSRSRSSRFMGRHCEVLVQRAAKPGTRVRFALIGRSGKGPSHAMQGEQTMFVVQHRLGRCGATRQSRLTECMHEPKARQVIWKRFSHQLSQHPEFSRRNRRARAKEDHPGAGKRVVGVATQRIAYLLHCLGQVASALDKLIPGVRSGPRQTLVRLCSLSEETAQHFVCRH